MVQLHLFPFSYPQNGDHPLIAVNNNHVVVVVYPKIRGRASPRLFLAWLIPLRRSRNSRAARTALAVLEVGRDAVFPAKSLRAGPPFLFLFL
jgi:hypothetical protein